MAATASATMTAPAATADAPPGGPGKALNNWSSLIGIVTAIVGNVLIALALNVQRYAHTQLHKERLRVRQRALKRTTQSASQSGRPGEYGAMDGGQGFGAANGDQHRESGDGEPAGVASTYLKSPCWWLGQILITVGEMGNFLAYGFAPASIVSPLGVVALISNCIIAPVMFHEQFRARDFWGVVIAVSGAVTVVRSAKQEETKLEPHDVWDAITTTEFEIYMAVTTLLILVLMWASRKYGGRTLLIDLGLVGLFGGYTVLATKGVSSMLSSTLWRAFATPVTYVLVLILLVTAVMQIRYVNKALQRFDSTQVIPIQFVLFTLCVILGSAILYRDFEKTTAKQASQFIGGCLLTFFGVFLITSGRQQQQQQDDDDEDILSDAEGVEETIGLTQHEGNASTPVQEDVPTPKAQSRRSSRLSRVSFSETVKTEPRPDESDVPVIRHPGATESAPDFFGQESSPLLSNPWREPWDDSEQPFRGGRASSADSVAMASAASLTPTNSNSFPSTPPMRDSPMLSTYYTHADRPLASRTASHRRSKTFISPSPLSSTVTTVVKDAFLRGYDSSLGQRSSLRRIRSSIRASLFLTDEYDRGGAASHQAAGPGSDEHVARTLRGQESGGARAEDAGRRRSRSVSDALGEFFRPRKKKKGFATSDVDVEAGASSDAGGSERTRTQ